MQSAVVVKSWQQELEAVGHIASSAVKEKAMDAGAQFAFSFLFSSEPQDVSSLPSWHSLGLPLLHTYWFCSSVIPSHHDTLLAKVSHHRHVVDSQG